MRVYLLEDGGGSQFEPFALTRPVGEILFGCETLRARIERFVGTTDETPLEYLAPKHLQGFQEPGSPGLAVFEELEAPCLVISSRFVPEESLGDPGKSTALVSPEGRLIGWHIQALGDLPDDWRDLGAPYHGLLPSVSIQGRLLETVWQLMAENAGQITADLSGEAPAHFEPFAGPVFGTHPVYVSPDVLIGPHVVFDTRQGPIRVDSGVVIEPLTVLRGPCVIGAQTTLLGGVVRSSSIGPHCRVRGEVGTSVILGYTNKAHDGYLGHAVVGRWVNLGAMTTNSDLKNNYSSVRVDLGSGPTDTGERKVGVFLGDHVKTGIGTLLGTGTVVGAGSNVMAGPIPPRNIKPFSWGSGAEFFPYDLERFLATAKIIMGRRSQTLNQGMEALLRRSWRQTHGDSI